MKPLKMALVFVILLALIAAVFSLVQADDGEDEDSAEVEMVVRVVSPRPSGGVVGGDGGGRRDTTPPVISGLGLCPDVAVTETTADICWITDELGDSQVEFWASEHMLSPLDERLLFKHHVRLTDLTPATTYHYCAMSCDFAGNLAISDEQTFTTLGEVPVADFTLDSFFISPEEVDIGEPVTLGVSVTNIGNATGSYTVILEINGIAEATEEVTLDAGASTDVAFTTQKDVPGIYMVEVDGSSGSFTVKEEVAPTTPSASEEPPSRVNWAILGPVIGISVFLAVFLPIRVRGRGVR